MILYVLLSLSLIQYDIRIMSTDAQPTPSVSTTAYIPHGCRRMLCVDDSAVESPSTESLHRPRAPMSPRAHSSSPHSDSSSPLTRSQSLGTLLPSQSPRALSHSQSPRARIPSPRTCTQSPRALLPTSTHQHASPLRAHVLPVLFRTPIIIIIIVYYAKKGSSSNKSTYKHKTANITQY